MREGDAVCTAWKLVRYNDSIDHMHPVDRNLQEEEVVLMADARAEEATRKAEAQLKKKREQEVKEAERDAAEMANLMANDPEVRVVSSLHFSTKALEAEERKTDGFVGNFDPSFLKFRLHDDTFFLAFFISRAQRTCTVESSQK